MPHSTDPEYRQRVVADALGQLKLKKEPSKTFAQNIAEKGQLCVDKAWQTINPIILSGGALKPQDREGSLRPIIYSSLLESLHELSKDELENLCAVLFGERIMQDVEANPSGRSQGPDLLSGL